MKKIIVSAIVIAVAASAAWYKRADIILAAAKFRTSQIYADLPPAREIPWQQGPASPQIFDGERPPNIILIVADDFGYNDISAFGGGVAGLKTPSIDRISAEGVAYTQSYSGASTCAPSRAMMMTGRYPTRTGFEFTPTPAGMLKTVYKVGKALKSDDAMPPAFYDADMDAQQPSYEEKGLPTSEVTVAEVLKESGYYTAHIGKWHLGRANGSAAHDQGFDDSLLMQSGLYLPENDPNVINAKLPFDAIDKFLWAGMGYSASFNSGDTDLFKPGGYLTDYWTEESIKVIKANKNRPFFLYLAHWGAHTPLQATREDYEAVGDIKPHRKRVYAAMVRAVDRSVGKIMEALEAEGIAENTMVIFTSDNGGPGYLGLSDINLPFRGWKITLFEGGIRVPLFIKWPGKIPAGSRVDTPVAHIDMMPTIAAAAGATPPEKIAIDGLNVLPLVTEEGVNNWQRETLFWQSGHYQVVRHGDWKLLVNDRPTDGLKKWLFNLAEDPTEQNNLAKSRLDKVQELSALLEAHQSEARGSLWSPVINTPILIDKTKAAQFTQGDEYIYMPN
ncbi:sulfatase [Microbulbifer agarilyticus]|uniref:sulfatase n=1 Tax=Microbulbifer agarilyticus TaxID=260552 RepID=UPI001C97A868|nr:sulfatase [Microbulbifer agarilyticus]MBY6191109.1 sulfatase [Microbulbifer agarilyticus]